MAIYDVFISYHGEDRDLALDLADKLQRVGLQVWIDRAHLRPGTNWLPELERALSNSNAVAVLIGGGGPGPWQSVEIGSALLRFAESGNPVIPVFLPNASPKDLIPSLSRNTPIYFDPSSVSHDTLSQMVWAITERRMEITIGQFGEDFVMDVPAEPHLNSMLRVGTLPNPAQGRLLQTTWATFGEGIDRIVGQVKSFGKRIDVDACLGINEAGLVMATFFASTTFNRCALGYLKCLKSGSLVALSPDTLLPDLGPTPTIVLCDFEVKYSDVVGYITTVLRERYENPTLFFAVFGAMTEEADLRIAGFDDLTGAEIIRQAGFESIFIAATMSPPGIEPPLELR